MAIIRGFNGFETGDNSDCFSFLGLVGLVGDGTARTGKVYVKNRHLTAGIGGRVQFVAPGAIGATLNVGEQAVGWFRVFMRLRQYPSATNVCLVGLGRRADGRSVSSSLALDTTGKIAARTGNTFSPYGSVSLQVNTWYRIEVKQLLTRTSNPANDTCQTTVWVYAESGSLIDTATVTVSGVSYSQGINSPEIGGDGFVSSTHEADFDDAVWYLADKADVAAAALPAGTRITPVRATGPGAFTEFTGDWRNVLDWPRDTTVATDQSTATINATTTFTHRTAQSLGLGTITATKVIATAKAATAGNDALLWNGIETPTTLATSYGSGSTAEVAYDWTPLDHASWNAAEFGFRNKRGVMVDLANIMAEVLHDAPTDTRDPEVDGGDPTTSWRHVCGVYTGNGAFQKIPLPFRPSVLILKKANSTDFLMGLVWLGVFGGTSAKLQDSGMAGLNSSSIGGTSIGVVMVEDDGVTLGPSTSANRSGHEFEYLAIRDGGASPEGRYLTQGAYVGSGIDNTDVVMRQPFQPEVVITFGANMPVYRDTSFVGDASMPLGSNATTADLIQALNADGFQVGSHGLVNQNHTIVPYVAIRRGAQGRLDAFFAFGSFTASGSAHTVSGLPFSPHLVWADRPALGDAAWRAADVALHTGATSSNWATGSPTTTAVTALTGDGFTCGAQLAAAGETTRWMAFAQTGEVPLDEVTFEAASDIRGETVGLTWVEFALEEGA